MDFLFFDDVRKRPYLIPALIIVSSIAFLLVNIYGLTLGITYVLPHLFYIPIILAAYYYPRRGVFFAFGLSLCYCAVALTVSTSATAEMLSAVARSCVFIIIAGIVSYLSGRMHHDTEICRRLVSVFESSGDAIIGETPEGIITDWNAGAEHLYGYTSHDMVGCPSFRLSPPERQEEIRWLLEKILEGEIVERFETERITKDGTHLQVSLLLSPICNDTGAIVGISDIAHDITERQRFQNEILKAKDQWELTFDAVPDMIAIIDNQFRIVQVNRAMADRLGVSPEGAVGLLCYEVVHHTRTPPAICPHQLLLRDSQSHSTDIHEDNLHGDFFLTVSPICDPSGAVLGSVHILRDISERKRAEKQVQESEAKFREIFNFANDAIHLHDLDERDLPGKFIDVNESACRMLQYSKEELLEMSPLDLTTLYHSRPIEQIGKELKTKGSALFETEFRRKDGGIVPVEVNAHIVVIQGRRLGLSIIRDLTRRKHDEAAFRQLSADHKAIIDHAPAMIWYKDTKNTFIRVNPAAARAFGMPIEKIEGKSAYDLIPDLAEKYYQDDLEVINSGKPKLGIIETLTTAAGEEIWVQTDKIPLLDEHGTVTGILLFVVDITERKHAEDALALASRKLNLLSSITRHDIRNQLTALNAFILLSADVVDKRDELLAFFAKEQKIADAIARQISFTKDYEDLGVKSPVWQDVGALVLNAKAVLPMGTVGLDIRCPGLEVYADPLFEKVFYNLIDNSIRYGGDAMTTIRVAASEQGEDLHVIYEDDGKGISTEDKKQLFTKGFGNHTGLGLFLSREILSITGITIIENGEPGKGVRFEMTVPKGAWRITGNGI